MLDRRQPARAGGRRYLDRDALEAAHTTEALWDLLEPIDEKETE